MVKVSVIIPVYNVENYVERTLNSIINQTFDSFEIIIINDGSTDNTEKIVRNVLSKSGVSYKIIYQKNSGVSAARNLGIKNSSGKYIYFIDGDDYAELSLLKELYDESEITKSGVVFAGYDHVDLYGNSEDKGKFNKYLRKTVNGKEATKEMISDKIWICMNSGLYRKDIIINNNIQFDTRYRYNEDVLFTLRCLYSSTSVSCVKKELVHYVRRPASAMNSPNKRYSDLVYGIEKFKEYIVENNDIDKQMIIKLNEYKIPNEIIRFFRMSSIDKNTRNYAVLFVKNKNISKYLTEYKLEDVNIKKVLKYVFAKALLVNPKFVSMLYYVIMYKKL